jgi:hypothetical protein
MGSQPLLRKSQLPLRSNSSFKGIIRYIIAASNLGKDRLTDDDLLVKSLKLGKIL